MISRIKALVVSGLTVQMTNLRMSYSTFSVHIFDGGEKCHDVATDYDWQHGGDADRAIESAVSKAEAYLSSKVKSC